MSETAGAVQDIFSQMADRLNVDVAKGMDSVIQYDITGDGGAKYYAAIKDGACTVSEGTHDSPTMTLSMADEDFVNMIQGKLDGMSAFMSGKLKITGDMGLAMKLQTLFRNQ